MTITPLVHTATFNTQSALIFEQDMRGFLYYKKTLLRGHV